MTRLRRLEVFGFNLPKTPENDRLVQKALNAKVAKNYRRLYHLLHKIKVQRRLRVFNYLKALSMLTDREII